MTTTIQKWGNSQGVRIPKHILDAIKWQANEPLSITAENGKIIIEKAVITTKKNIKELFADYTEEYSPIEIDWGKPEGNEIW